jgi:hypothetical protein
MHPAIQGAIFGVVIGLALVLFEYTALNKAVNERAKKLNRKAEFDVTERRRIAAVVRFAIFLPPGFALGWWLVSSMI